MTDSSSPHLPKTCPHSSGVIPLIYSYVSYPSLCLSCLYRCLSCFHPVDPLVSEASGCASAMRCVLASGIGCALTMRCARESGCVGQRCALARVSASASDVVDAAVSVSASGACCVCSMTSSGRTHSHHGRHDAHGGHRGGRGRGHGRDLRVRGVRIFPPVVPSTEVRRLRFRDLRGTGDSPRVCPAHARCVQV